MSESITTPQAVAGDGTVTVSEEGTVSVPEAESAQTMPSDEEIREALKDVIDPELGINIVDLGLIYEVLPNLDNRQVVINMTLTSPGCPAGPEIKSSVWLTVKRMKGVEDCEVNLVWKPRWDPSVHASEEGQMFLGIW